MLKSEPINAFAGFGNGGRPGEYYFSQGMGKSRFGIMPQWQIVKLKDQTTLSGLGSPKWFAQRGSDDFCIDSNGLIYKSASGVGAWALDRTPGPSYIATGNGLIGDQKNRLLYPQKRYLGMYDGSTWTDNWKDFGTDIGTALIPSDTYEDVVIFLRNNNVCRLNNDDSLNADASPAFTMPSGFTGIAVSSGKSGILIGFNVANRGVLVLWDNHSDRAIAPWIWVAGQVQVIQPDGDNWIVVTTREVIRTNGYAVEDLTLGLDMSLGEPFFSCYPQGALVIDDKLVIANQEGGVNRKKSGFLVFDLKTRLFEFAPVHNFATYGLTPYAVWFDKQFSIFVSYVDNFLSKNVIGQLSYGGTTKAWLITEKLGQGDNDKTAEAVKLNLSLSSKNIGHSAISFDVSVKVYNFRRHLWLYGQTNGASSSADTLKVDGTQSVLNKAQVGDEVTILEGLNAGEVRHITSIVNSGLSNETWTMDAAFSNNTENAVVFNIAAFKKVEKKTISAAAELKDMYFDVKNKYRGKHFLVKILFENLNNALPELHSGQFIYDDLGIT
jgi:hypothetical protein